MYGEFLKAFNNPSHPEHRELKEWAGDQVDPERCDIEETNKMPALVPDEVFVDRD